MRLRSQCSPYHEYFFHTARVYDGSKNVYETAFERSASKSGTSSLSGSLPLDPTVHGNTYPDLYILAHTTFLSSLPKIIITPLLLLCTELFLLLYHAALYTLEWPPATGTGILPHSGYH